MRGPRGRDSDVIGTRSGCPEWSRHVDGSLGIKLNEGIVRELMLKVEERVLVHSTVRELQLEALARLRV